jgi:uncharacterized protein (TIGR03437 family)
MLKALLVLLFVASSYGQPLITQVVNSADGLPFIAPGSLISIFGSELSAQTASAEFAWPTALGGSSVLVCQTPTQCVSAGLLYVSPTQINVYAPTSWVTVRVSTGGATSPAALGEPSTVAPGIFEEGTDAPFAAGWKAWSSCNSTFANLSQPLPIRGAITDSAGSLVQSSNPARPGRYYTIWLTGLAVGSAELNYPDSLAVHFESIPVYGYSGTTCESVGASFVGDSPQFPGLNQVNFQVPTDLLGSPSNPENYPPLFPCGQYKLDLTLNLLILLYGPDGLSGYVWGGNSVQLPVLVEPGDVQCMN